MDVQRLAHDVGDRHARVQAGIRILEHDLHFLAELVNVLGRNLLAVVDDLARGGLVQVQYGASHGGLAAAALPHQAQRLAGLDIERDALHGLQGLAGKPAGADRKMLFQVLDLEEVFAHLDSASFSAAASS